VEAVKIVNESLLASMRGPGRCEYCHKSCKVLEAAHVFSKGAGRLDIRINLVSLGSTLGFECQCHSKSHNANSGNGVRPNLKDLIQVVSEREKVMPEDIKPVIDFIRRLPKTWSIVGCEHWMEGELTDSQIVLAKRELKDFAEGLF
jgi:hypothetical protein